MSNKMSDSDTFNKMDLLRLLSLIAWLLILFKWPFITSSITFLIIGGVAIAYNAIIFWTTVICKEEASSVVPIFGGVFAAIGVVLLPVTESWEWAWIALLIDWGGIPLYLYALCTGSYK